VGGASSKDTEIYSPDAIYSFTIMPQLEILNTYVLTISLPLELEVKQNSECVVSGSIDKRYSCKADSLSNMITISNFLIKDLKKGDKIQFSVNSIRNPVDYIKPGEVEF
jgi:hypothetical protein